MSDLETESRASAVGRKRTATGKYKDFSSSNSRQASISSKESGEVSSSDDAGGEGEDSDVLEISERQYNKRQKTDETSREGEDSDVMEISERQYKTRWKSGGDGKEDEVEHGDSSADMDTSDSDSEDSSFEILQPKNDVTRIQDLSQHDRDAQAKYFNIINAGDQVRCLCCGEFGHMATVCPQRMCSHCQQRDQHQSSACPTYRKCGLCRERGHDARACRSRAFLGPDPCDICTEAGHIEEECPYLWRLSTPVAQPTPRSGFTAVNPGSRVGLNYDEDQTPPPPPSSEPSRPWQLMGLFDDRRDFHNFQSRLEESAEEDYMDDKWFHGATKQK